MEENEIEEGEFTEVLDEALEEVTDAIDEEIAVKADAPPAKMGLNGFLKAITNAVSSDQISSGQAREIRQGMGIYQGYFTRSRNSDAKKAKAKRKAQKAARKTNRKKR